MNFIKTPKERLAEGLLTICLNEMNWNIVRNDCDEWVEIAYAMISPKNEVYIDELYMYGAAWEVDSEEKVVDHRHLVSILDALNQRYKLWGLVTNLDGYSYRMKNKKVKKIVIDAAPGFGILTPEAEEYIKEYFEIPVEILN